MYTEITYINARRPKYFWRIFVLPKIIHLFCSTWLFYGASFISPFYFASALPEKARCYPVNSRDADVQRSYNWPFASSPTRWSSTISRRWSLSRPGDGETAFEKRERHDPVSVESRHSRSRIIRKQYNGIGFELRTYIGFIPAVNKSDQRHFLLATKNDRSGTTLSRMRRRDVPIASLSILSSRSHSRTALSR